MKAVNKKFVITNNATGTDLLMSIASKTKKTVAKKDDKEVITVTDDTVSDAIDTCVAQKKIADIAIAKLEGAKEIIKKEGGEPIWINDMEKTGRLKDSFYLKSKNGASVLYTVTDAYKRSDLDKERIKHLQTTLGKDIISTENKFIINMDMLKAHPEIGNKLVEFISSNVEIQKILKIWNKDKSADDKESVIQIEQKHVITKGTKDKIREIAQANNVDVKYVLSEVQPICQIKVSGTK